MYVLKFLIIDILSRYYTKGPHRIFGLGPHHVLIRPWVHRSGPVHRSGLVQGFVLAVWTVEIIK